jgi:hypothetical protein
MDGHPDPRVALQDAEEGKVAFAEGPFEDLGKIAHRLVIVYGQEEIQAIGHGRLLLF